VFQRRAFAEGSGSQPEGSGRQPDCSGKCRCGIATGQWKVFVVELYSGKCRCGIATAEALHVEGFVVQFYTCFTWCIDGKRATFACCWV
jgi:hypothetical protein